MQTQILVVLKTLRGLHIDILGPDSVRFLLNSIGNS